MVQTVCIVGLGYVGLPLACLCADKGYNTIGYDINQEIVSKLKQGITVIKEDDIQYKVGLLKEKIHYTTDPAEIKKSDIVIICVPTPVDDKRMPDLVPVISASKTVNANLKQGALVILESTIHPGTCEELVLPLFDPKVCGREFYLAHCHERIDPGNHKWNVTNIPRVVGGITDKCCTLAYNFYTSILSANVLKLNSIKAAEATKIMENSFRDINIAFMNEMAKSFTTLGIDITEVIKAASTKPFSFLPHWPGCGVGGHCIPVDPYYLIEKAKKSGFEHRFLMLAREINNSMPSYTLDLVVEALNKVGKSVKNTKITVLGVAYKPNVNDIRESPSFDIINHLRKLGANLIIYDPFIPAQSNAADLDEALNTECVVLVTAHDMFKSITPEMLRQNNVKAVIDGRNVLDKAGIIKEGIIYKGIGR